jgi:hypothetical protein
MGRKTQRSPEVGIDVIADIERVAPPGKLRVTGHGRTGIYWSLPWIYGDHDTIDAAREQIRAELSSIFLKKCPQLYLSLQIYDDAGNLLEEQEGGTFCWP